MAKGSRGGKYSARKDFEFIPVGNDLYTVNKMAKNIRDARAYNRGEYSFYLSKEESDNYENTIKQVLGLSQDQYNNSTERGLEFALKTKEQELYKLKQDVIDAAKNRGIKDSGFHEFKYINRYGNSSYTYSKYIIIGNQGFHYDQQNFHPANMKNLGKIEGLISSESSVTYTQAAEAVKRLRKWLSK